MRALTRFLRAFRRDARGVSAVEFALIAPLLLVLYAGLVEICQAMMAERKASHVASAVGDLVAQAETISSSDVTDIFTIGRTLMTPFPSNTLKQRVSSVTADSQAKPRVDWSRGSGFSALAKNAVVTLPMTLNAGDSIVLSETAYTFKSPIGYVLPQTMTYTETFYLRPRRTDKVVCDSC